MKLVVFDIDGTLTRTNHIDAWCFARAFEAAGLSAEDEDWTGCRNVTDNGITEHIFQQQRGRSPSPEEVQQLRHAVVELLQTAAREQPQAFLQVPGADVAVKELGGGSEWAVSVASGCWQPSGRLKLAQAGLQMDKVPAAFADDGVMRIDVVASAIAQARAHYGQEEFDRIVSIGDGVWDIAVARQLKLPFIGIHGHGRSDGLRESGARHILSDYSDLAEFFRALDEAVVPD